MRILFLLFLHVHVAGGKLGGLQGSGRPMSTAGQEMCYRKGLKKLFEQFKEDEAKTIEEAERLIGTHFPINVLQLEFIIEECSSIELSNVAKRGQDIKVARLKKLMNNLYIPEEKKVEDWRTKSVTQKQIESIQSKLKDLVNGFNIRVQMAVYQNQNLEKGKTKYTEEPCRRFKQLLNDVNTLFESKLTDYVAQQIERLGNEPATLETLRDIKEEAKLICQLKVEASRFGYCKDQLFDKLLHDLQRLSQKRIEDYLQDRYNEQKEKMDDLINAEPTLDTINAMNSQVQSIKELRGNAEKASQHKQLLFDGLLDVINKSLALKLKGFMRKVGEEIKEFSEQSLCLDEARIIFIDDTQRLIKESTEYLERLGYSQPNQLLNEIISNIKQRYVILFLSDCMQKFDLSIESIATKKAKLVRLLELFRERSIFDEETLKDLEKKVTLAHEKELKDLFTIYNTILIQGRYEKNYSDYVANLEIVQKFIEVINVMLEHEILSSLLASQIKQTIENLTASPRESLAQMADRIKAAHQKPLDESLHGLQIKYSGPSSRNHQKLTLQPTQFFETKVSTSNGDGKIDASVLVPYRNVFTASMLLDLLVCNPDEYNDKVVIASSVLSNCQYSMVKWLQENLANKTMDQKLGLVATIMEELGGTEEGLNLAQLIWHKRTESEQGPKFSGLKPCKTFKEALNSANGAFCGFVIPKKIAQDVSDAVLQSLHILSNKFRQSTEPMSFDGILSEYLNRKSVEDGYLLSSVSIQDNLYRALKASGFEFILGDDDSKCVPEATIIRNQHTKFIVWREGNKITCIIGSLNFSASGLGLCPEGRLENICVFTQTFKTEAKATVFMKQFTEFKKWILEQKKS